MKKNRIVIFLVILCGTLILVGLSGCGGGEELPQGEVVIGGDKADGVDESDGSDNAADDSDSENGSSQSDPLGLDDIEGRESGEAGSAQGEEEDPNLPPFIQIVSPTEGQTIKGTKIRVEVKVKGFKLVDKFGQPAVKGQGHIHYTFDDAEPIPSDKTVFESGVSPQPHTIKVELRNNDHTALDPPVEAVVHYTSSIN